MNTPATSTDAIVISQYEKLQADIAIIQQEDAKAAFDYEDSKGNKLARSHIHSMRQVKGKIEAARKEAKAYALAYGRRVDALAKDLTEQVEALMAPHVAAITAIEQREEERIAGHRACIIEVETTAARGTTAAEIRAALVDMMTGSGRDMEEFKAEHDAAVLATIRTLEERLQAAEKAEAEAAELARLRKEAAERAEAERITRIEAEAVERERKRQEAEERKRVEEEARKRAEAEAKAKAEQEAKDRAAREAIAAAERREMESKLAAERAAREKVEAERRAAEAEERSRKEVERREREAAEAKARQEAEAKAKAERREAMIEDITRWLLDQHSPEHAATAIVDGKAPHLRMVWA